MELFQGGPGAMFLTGVVIVFLFALPVATRRWAWLWPLVVVTGLGLAANAYLTFTDFWADRHGFLRMWALVLAWPFIVGLFATSIGAWLHRFAKPGFRSLFLAVILLALLIAVAPYVSLFIG